ncbi:type IV pilus secretin PilQ [Halothiobacillus neapolitanus]|uniref:Type IV pilus secretin PilQ n=1 Tax=Halothiobacillus neapolitanus (strain ATCC 23641 / DSM 15147 / CIP 104769 / NCIMB 8539 / c2) TaxID=555778 RepID=D0L240_HALNC|nr:type IV pilus secretin PilQ [Halothiobacillus neapolitanus]ACX96763.1 type IV pilus secretin PilQ [Halothiobacillus neapolitanus c2]TDN65128.1 type IV pilus assembly protein PilQ [Halothiobacillus neapolitanus]
MNSVMDAKTLYRPLTRAIRQSLGVLSISILIPAIGYAGDINTISTDRTADGSIQVHFKLSSPLSGSPDNFQIDNPARVAIDLPDTTNKTGERTQKINLGPVKSLMMAEAGGKTRVVFNLTQATPYAINPQGNELTVTFKPAATSNTTATGLAVSTMADNNPATAMDRGQSIDFRRSADGAGRLLIQTSGPNAPMKMRSEGSNIIIDLPNTRVESGRFGVKDFATPVESVDVRPMGSGSRITLKTRNAGEHMAYQTDNRLVVEVKPVPKAEGAQNVGEKKYTGERLTLKFQDIQIRPLLQLIADFTGNNIVVSDDVKGSISLRLENVPWDQALDLILTTKGLSMRKNGNVMYVAPTADIVARDKAEIEARQQSQQLAPLSTDIIQINYAKADDIYKLLESASKTGKTSADGKGGDTAQRFISDRGSVTVDPRSNSLIVTDTASALDRIRDLIHKLDKPVKQVLIETRIVIATDNFARQLGVRWGVQAGFNRGNSTFGLGSTAPLVASGTSLPTAGASTGTVGTAPTDWMVNTPISGTPAGSLGLAILGSNVLLDLELSALQSEGTGEIVSSPKVITTNGHTALISQGTEIPYIATQTAGGVASNTVSFKKAVLSTEVTPQITPNNNIIMDIDVKKDEPDYTNLLPGTTNPPINTREVKTKVEVKNGETVVLGGIYQFENNNSINKVPFFGDLPGIGNLFKNKEVKNQRLELLIFVTPKIINSDQSLVNND